MIWCYWGRWWAGGGSVSGFLFSYPQVIFTISVLLINIRSTKWLSILEILLSKVNVRSLCSLVPARESGAKLSNIMYSVRWWGFWLKISWSIIIIIIGSSFATIWKSLNHFIKFKHLFVELASHDLAVLIFNILQYLVRSQIKDKLGETWAEVLHDWRILRSL